MKKTKMIFSVDMFYTDLNVPLYTAGKVYEVEERMVGRWLKRGGNIVGDETVNVPNPEAVVTEPTPDAPPTAPPKKEDDKKPAPKADDKKSAPKK